jgi:hypothetical protein
MALLNEGPAGPLPPSSPPPAGSEPRSRYDFSQPPKKRRPWLIPLLVVIGLVVIVVAYQAGQRSTGMAPQQAAPTYAPPYTRSTGTTGSITMPNFVGTTTIQQAANQLRARLGQQLSVEAPGGSSVGNQIVGRQYPPAGQLVHSLMTVSLYPTAGSTYQPSTQTPPVRPAGTYTAGTYVVGSDIQAGTYRTDGPTGGSRCYWARLEDTTGDFESIISNGNAQGPTTLTIRSSDGAVELSGSCTWTRR